MPTYEYWIWGTTGKHLHPAVPSKASFPSEEEAQEAASRHVNELNLTNATVYWQKVQNDLRGSVSTATSYLKSTLPMQDGSGAIATVMEVT